MSTDAIEKLYKKQINGNLSRLKEILETQDQDYINVYLKKIIESSFNRGWLQKKDLPLLAKILNDTIEYNTQVSKEDVKERDWFVILDYLINLKIDVCAVCKSKLHYQSHFPKDYPDKWKLCCNHRDRLIAYIEKEYNADTKITHSSLERSVGKQEIDIFEELFTL